MNRILISFLLLGFFILAAPLSSSAQDKDELAVILKELVETCSDFSDTLMIEGQEDPRFFKKAADLVVYGGLDSSRSFTSLASYKTPDDQDQVDAMCLQLNEAMAGYEDYQVTDYFVDKDEDNTWYVLEIGLLAPIEEEGEEDAVAIAKFLYMGFLKIEGKYGLANISEY